MNLWNRSNYARKGRDLKLRGCAFRFARRPLFIAYTAGKHQLAGVFCPLLLEVETVETKIPQVYYDEMKEKEKELAPALDSRWVLDCKQNDQTCTSSKLL